MNDLITSFICCKVAVASVEPADMMNPRSTSGGIGSTITKNKRTENTLVFRQCSFIFLLDEDMLKKPMLKNCSSISSVCNVYNINENDCRFMQS